MVFSRKFIYPHPYLSSVSLLENHQKNEYWLYIFFIYFVPGTATFNMVTSRLEDDTVMLVLPIEERTYVYYWQNQLYSAVQCSYVTCIILHFFLLLSLSLTSSLFLSLSMYSPFVLRVCLSLSLFLFLRLLHSLSFSLSLSPSISTSISLKSVYSVRTDS